MRHQVQGSVVALLTVVGVAHHAGAAPHAYLLDRPDVNRPETALSSAVRADGRLFVVGSADSSDPQQAWVAAFAPDGPIVWSLGLQGPSRFSDARAVGVTSDGGLVVAGTLDREHVFVRRMDGDGSLTWETAFDFSPDSLVPERVRGLSVLSDDSTVVTAASLPTSGAESTRVIFKVDSTGALAWSLAESAPELEADLFGPTLLPDGHLIVHGRFLDPSVSDDSRPWLMKLDPADGTILWQRSYHWPGWFPWVQGPRALAGDGIGITASTTRDGDGRRQAWLLRFDTDGNPSWQRSWRSDRNGGSSRLLGLSSGELVIALTTGSSRVSDADVALGRFSAAGELRWERHLGDGDLEGDSVAALHAFPDGELGLVVQTNGLWPQLPLTGALPARRQLLIRTGPDGLIDPCCDVDVTGIWPRLELTELPPPEVEETAITLSPLLPVEPALRLTEQDLPFDMAAICEEREDLPPVDPPPEVSPPGAAEPLLVRPGARISWDMTWEDASAAGACRYRVYRGALSELRSAVPPGCLRAAQPETVLRVRDPPPPGDGWYYLVAGIGFGGLGEPGRDSNGRLRLTGPCP